MPEKCRESFLSNSSTPGARLAAVAPRRGSPGASPGDRRARKTGASRLSFQVDGNIVVYRSDGTKLWQRGASSNRRSTTVYYWENYENSTCNNIMYSIAHTQLDPDPNLSGDLDRWEVCY